MASLGITAEGMVWTSGQMMTARFAVNTKGFRSAVYSIAPLATTDLSAGDFSVSTSPAILAS